MPPPPRNVAEVRAVAGRLVAHLDELLPELGATYRREIDGYARLSDAQLEAQVLATSRRLVEGYFGRLAEGRDPARVDLTAMELVGRRRLEMGLSLDDALHAFRLAAREVWRAIAEVIAPGEEAALVSLASGWIERLDQASSRVATGYLEASHDRLRREDARRHGAVDALLGAADHGEVAAVGERHALAFASRYQPVVLVGDTRRPSGSTPGFDLLVASTFGDDDQHRQFVALVGQLGRGIGVRRDRRAGQFQFVHQRHRDRRTIQAGERGVLGRVLAEGPCPVGLEVQGVDQHHHRVRVQEARREQIRDELLGALATHPLICSRDASLSACSGSGSIPVPNQRPSSSSYPLHRFERGLLADLVGRCQLPGW